MATKINIVDAVMGSGKTHAAINFINAADEDVRFIYITPYKTEVQRILKSCAGKDFVEPEDGCGKTKLSDFRRLLREGRNIASTHALFKRLDYTALQLIRDGNYILIMDEVAEVITQLKFKDSDKDELINFRLNIGFDGMCTWKDSEYDGRFNEEKRLADAHSLYYSHKTFYWILPVRAFGAFTEVYVLTYMFNAQLQKYYYDFYGMEYNYIYVTGDAPEEYRFVTEKPPAHTYNYRELIDIYDKERYNEIGDKKFSLSKSWFARVGNKTEGQRVRKNIRNFIRTLHGASSKECLWTSFKSAKSHLCGDGYAKSFVPLNCRATNLYRNRTVVVYAANRYIDAFVKRFFENAGVEVDEDGYALSEMLQFIWRSAIRDGKKIYLYIPSKRMRTLLQKWIEENSS